MRIRYVGDFGNATGFGRSAEDFCRALVHEPGRVELEIVPIGSVSWRDNALGDLERYGHRSGETVDATIIHAPPIDCARIRRDLEGSGLLEGKTIAYTTWETEAMPADIADGLRVFDEIWTPSLASSLAISLHQGYLHGGEQLNVKVIPHCFDDRQPSVHRSLFRQGWSDSDSSADKVRPPERDHVRFYWIGTWTARKNPQGMLRAFASRFTAIDPVELVMHSPGADLITCHAAVAQTNLPQDQLPKITFSNKMLTDEQIWELHAANDVFVSTSRGEAWNLPAFEAMLMGNRIIAPERLGSDDFLCSSREAVRQHNHNGTDAHMVGSRLDFAHVTVVATQQRGNGQVAFATQGAQGLTSRCMWREPSLLDVAIAMDHAKRRVEHGVRGKVNYNPSEHFGYKAVADRIIERIGQ